MENILLKARIEKIEKADVITTEAAVESADWKVLPLTLRDDMVSIIEGEPEESEVFSHENDAAEDYDIAGTGMRLTGSFIKATREQLVDIMDGTKKGSKFAKSAKLLTLENAFRITLRNGNVIIIPRAKGAVCTEINVGHGGVSKFPFNFRLLQASPDWDCTIMW